jgi:flagellar basal-body rod protein FlgG
MALQGQGYFQVLLPTGETAYTRAGSFQLSDQGELVTNDGYPVQPGITIPQGAVDVIVSKTGEVQIKLAGNPALQTVGQLQLANFVNEAGLEAMGDNLFKETQASGQPTVAAPGEPGFGTVAQGFLEASNVNPVAEITALITAQRAYEMNSRIVKAADEMLQTTSQLR